ncbi:hypothetical protein BD410DRAFT_760025 [Rickenella mellea]|uniref:F-box domain-containing protein n=1 Tax=Rickenella mellea TaxID=50990 RepID=A0A4Y7QMX2_9AGAM|nr:hypothetical protein BD410DRAFT_760025 [Rickenella mellea]
MGAQSSRIASGRVDEQSRVTAASLASHQSFYKLPPEIWTQIAPQLGRSELSALALTSRNVYRHANVLLYKELELSFGRCSQTYIDSLHQTLTDSADLASLVDTLHVDLTVPCQVWSYETFSSKTRDFRKKNRRPLPAGDFRQKDECNAEAIKMLDQLVTILPLLQNVQIFTLVLGRFDKDPTILHSLLRSLPLETISTLKSFKLRDLVFVRHQPVSSFASLRSIDLGYTSLKNTELHQLLLNNSGTLENLTLDWIIESSQVPFFSSFQEMSLPSLKTFNWKGRQPCDCAGLQGLLHQCRDLLELRAEGLSESSALSWADVLAHLTQNCPKLACQQVAFGAPTASAAFWDAVSSFLSQNGGSLNELSISGSGRTAPSPFPAALQNFFFRVMEPRHDMKRLVIVWRDSFGVDYETVCCLAPKYPMLELLHIYFTFPTTNSTSLTDLLRAVQPYHCLRQLHFVFSGNGEPSHNLRAEFMWKASGLSASLQRVSWSSYNLNANANPPVFVELHREPRSPVVVEDISSKVIAHDWGCTEPYSCTVGTKKVWTSQKPSWRENMGSRFTENRDICEYADFDWAIPGQR